MGVPNTTTFELQDVVDEVNPTTDDLVDCFADANANYFDSTYEGSKNQLLNFRNYGSGNALTSAYRYAFAGGKPVLECEVSRAITTEFWHDGSNLLPGIGDTCYTSATGSSYLGNGNWMIRSTSGTSTPTRVITITGGSGVISAVMICIF